VIYPVPQNDRTYAEMKVLDSHGRKSVGRGLPRGEK